MLTVVESHSVLPLREFAHLTCVKPTGSGRCTGGGLNEHHRDGAVGAATIKRAAAHREPLGLIEYEVRERDAIDATG